MDESLKTFFSSPLTKSLRAEIVRDEYPYYQIIYTLTNTALVVKIDVQRNEDEYFMRISTKPTEQIIEIRPDGDKDYAIYLETHNTKEVKEIINILKSKFFQIV